MPRKSLTLLAFGLAIYAAAIAANPMPWNPFSMTARGDNTQVIRGVVTDFLPNEPPGGCSFTLHHSDALEGVRVVIDASRGGRARRGDCGQVARALGKVADPMLDRVIVKAKGRVIATPTGEGIGEEARAQLRELLEDLGCTASGGGISPSLSLGPLQEAKEEIDRAAKRLGEQGPTILSKARMALDDAQLDLERSQNLTGGRVSCALVGAAEVEAALTALPAAQQQTLHPTSIQVDVD